MCHSFDYTTEELVADFGCLEPAIPLRLVISTYSRLRVVHCWRMLRILQAFGVAFLIIKLLVVVINASSRKRVAVQIFSSEYVDKTEYQITSTLSKKITLSTTQQCQTDLDTQNQKHP